MEGDLGMIKEKTKTTKFNEARMYLEEKIPYSPVLGVVLGSGLGGFVDTLEDRVEICYKDIPHFPQTTVRGHSGKLVCGRLKEKIVLAMQGRFHYYEGYDLQQVTFPIRVMLMMGIKKLIVTNAAGGINQDYSPGDLVLIKDHLNLMGANPLRGINISTLGPRFPDLSEAYSVEMRELGRKILMDLGLKPHEGVYAAVSGPSYETPAEIRFLKTIGADLVGMSTVPEVIVANHGGAEVLGVSCVTNYAAGIKDQKLDHTGVIAIADQAEEKFINFMTRTIELLRC